jgi:hypothetical protein
VIKDANDVLIGTYDNVNGINSNFINYTGEQEIQTATANQTVFTLTTMQYQPGTNSLSVFVDGVNQYGPGAQYAYVETSSTVITFVSGLHVGASVKFTTATINAASYSDAFQISYTPPFTASVPTNVGVSLSQYISVKDFGAVGDGVVDDTAALQAARDYLASLSSSGIELPTLLFPAGIYKYSLSPNWALNKISLQTVGEVRMRYTGVGDAFIIDGGTASVTMYSLTFSRFIIEAPSTAGNGVYIRNIHHSTFDFQVQGAGSASSGIYVAFSVCSVFYSPKVSVNDGGWYLGAKPNNGMYLTNAVVGIDSGFTSYCTFVNPIIEGTTQGIQVHRGLGNTFIGGTSEGITDTAIIIHDTSIRNKFFTIDMEVNLGDVLCNGQENEFYGIDSNGIFQFGSTSKRNLIVGGNFETISISSGAEDNTLTGVRYNIAGAGNLVNSGTRTRLRDLYNVQTDLHHNTVPTQIVSGPGPSPYTFTNTTGNDMTISIAGGTVSYIGVIRDGVSNGVGFSNGQVYLSANDGLEIVYTVAPTLITLNR